MSAPALWDIPEKPIRYLPEAAMVAMLRKRHTQVTMGSHRWAFADHVVSPPWGSGHVSIADFLAVDGWKGRDGWPVHGFEIKASRADWLAELRKPEKSEGMLRFCNRWWLVVSDERIVREGELPPKWGLLGVRWGGLYVIRKAGKLTPEPWPPVLIATFARAVAKSARAGFAEELDGGK